MNSLRLVLLPLLFILVSCSEPKQVSGPEIQALDYIVKENIGGNLSSFASRIARSTNTYKMIKSQLGDTDTNKLVSGELERVIEKHQNEWNSNLSQSYSEFLSKEEINSLYYNGKDSPYFIKQEKLKKKIGLSMQRKSEGLLKKTVSEAMNSAFKRISK